MKRDARALEATLVELDRGLLKRRRATLATASRAAEWPNVTVDGRRALDFCSNDYLALARHPDIAAAMAAAAVRHGAGSGASHLVAGHGCEHVFPGFVSVALCFPNKVPHRSSRTGTLE